tara:strand:- start:1097 stop:1918 length:822 start_codon:yes stop_codon:yes gene_type:complete
MKYDLTIFIPGFRTPQWSGVYESAKAACKRYNWEMVFVGPFDLPEELKDKENVLLVRDYGTVTRCAQRGLLETRSDLFFLTVDDCTFAEDSIDLAMDLYKKECGYKDVIAMIYGEGGNLMETKYWEVKTHGDFRLPGVDQSWKIANQCLMNKNYFIELGGLDCTNFEYIDKPIHDFMFRLQKDGGKIYFSPKHVCIASWYPGEEGDHAPIHNAQIHHDTPYFNMLYSMYNLYYDRIKLDYDNWKLSPRVWKRRFSRGVPKSYEELCRQEGYRL